MWRPAKVPQLAEFTRRSACNEITQRRSADASAETWTLSSWRSRPPPAAMVVIDAERIAVISGGGNAPSVNSGKGGNTRLLNVIASRTSCGGPSVARRLISPVYHDPPPPAPPPLLFDLQKNSLFEATLINVTIKQIQTSSITRSAFYK